MVQKPPLPFAQDKSFARLDDYLAHLESRGPTGVPWYRRIGPDQYELVTGRGRRGAPPRFSREDLLQRFGFAD
jgi:hypothetical protein